MNPKDLTDKALAAKIREAVGLHPNTCSLLNEAKLRGLDVWISLEQGDGARYESGELVKPPYLRVFIERPSVEL